VERIFDTPKLALTERRCQTSLTGCGTPSFPGRSLAARGPSRSAASLTAARTVAGATASPHKTSIALGTRFGSAKGWPAETR